MSCFFFFNDTATTEIYTLSLHDALPISEPVAALRRSPEAPRQGAGRLDDDLVGRSEEHTSELQSPCNLVCRLLLEKKKKNTIRSQHRLAPHHIAPSQTVSAPFTPYSN